jgi:hypothetical protein
MPERKDEDARAAAVDSRRVERLAEPDNAEEEAEELLSRSEAGAEETETNPDTAEDEAERLLASEPRSDEERPSEEPKKEG